MSHEVRIDRVPTAQSQPSPSPLMHPTHLGLPPLAPMPHGVLPVLPTALSMHSPHLLAQMSHFLMSLREQQHKLRLQDEAQNSTSITPKLPIAEDDQESESSISTTTTNNNNNNKVSSSEPQPLDLRLDSKKICKIKTEHNEDENRNLIDVVSMDSPPTDDINTHINNTPDNNNNNEDILDEEDEDMEDENDILDQSHLEESSESSSSPNSNNVQSELLAAHSAIMSRFQSAPSSNIPPEALEQVQRTLKQMLAHVSAKQSRAQAAQQNTSGKLER